MEGTAKRDGVCKSLPPVGNPLSLKVWSWRTYNEWLMKIHVFTCLPWINQNLFVWKHEIGSYLNPTLSTCVLIFHVLSIYKSGQKYTWTQF
jgi:hypothetical protein